VQDGWSEQGDDEDASLYPAAPIPAHERDWRHPSELGPVTLHPTQSPALGRGLMATAGIVGVSVAFGMIKLMSVANGTQVTAGSATSVAEVGVPPLPTATFRASTTSFQPAPPSTVPATPVVSATSVAVPPPTDSATEPTDAERPDPSTTLATLVPLSLEPMTTVAVGPAGQPAVVWDGGSYAISTADGLTVDTLTTVRLDSGVTRNAAVVLISDGLALIALPTSVAEAVSPLATMPPAGEQVSVESPVGAARATLEVKSDGAANLLAESPVTEGCAVRNTAGALVGITTQGDGTSTSMVSAARLDELVRSADRIGAWIGIKSSTDEPTAVPVTDVMAGSPAELAGILKGDVVTAVDGVNVSSFEHFAAMMRTFDGGQTVSVELVRNGERLSLAVILASRNERPGPPTSSTTTQPASATQSPPQNEAEPSESTEPDEPHTTE
jgi:hypothetical protein